MRVVLNMASLPSPLDKNPTTNANKFKRSFSLPQQILRLSLSILCVVFFLATLKIYGDKGVLNTTQINAFYAISGSLAIILSLSFFVRFTYSLSGLKRLNLALEEPLFE